MDVCPQQTFWPGTGMILQRVVVLTRDLVLQRLVRQLCDRLFLADDWREALEIIDSVRPELTVLDYSTMPGDTLEVLSNHCKSSIDRAVAVGVEPGRDEELLALARDHHHLEILRNGHDIAALRDIARKAADRSSADDNKDTTNRRFFATDFAARVGMVGKSKAIRETLEMIEMVAASNCNPVLIVGETGTGKELAASAVHMIRHADAPFVAVNCAALTATLLESELFGHIRGAFTGADRDKTGLLEIAGSGTIFLDEISEIPPGLQAKLLRLLQEKTFRKVGGVQDIECNATIIASSNRDLRKQVHDNLFRRDLFYRLNICPITLAPLRSPQRREDIDLLAEYFLRTSTICPRKTAGIKQLTKLALEALRRHHWPGNVRELRNVIEKAIILEKTDKIGLTSIVIDSLDPPSNGRTHTAARMLPIKDFSLAAAERELIVRALQETGWQKTRAASLLGITRATLYAKVRQYNISRHDSPQPLTQTSDTSQPGEPALAGQPQAAGAGG